MIGVKQYGNFRTSVDVLSRKNRVGFKEAKLRKVTVVK